MRILALALCGLLVLGVSARAEDTPAAAVYIAEMDDVPLVPGLVESVDDGMVFDQPEGRIVQAVAKGFVAADVVAAYYLNLLPQLGWQVDGEKPLLSFSREAEKLTIEMVNDETAALIVSFTLSPGVAP